MSKKDITKVMELSDKIYDGLTINKDIIEPKKDRDLYFEFVPDNLSKETVVAVKEYDENFVAASIHASGRFGIEAMQANSDVKIVTGKIPMYNKDYVGIVAERDRSFPVPGKEGEHTIKPFHVTQKLHINGIRNVGSVAKVHDILMTLAEEAFK